MRTLAALLAALVCQEPPQDTVKVARGDLSIRLEFEGAFEAVESAAVRCRLEAYQGELTIAQVVAHGRAVRKGDVLIRFDAKKAQEALADAESALAAAQAARDKAEEDWKLFDRGERLAMEAAAREARHAAARLDLFQKVDMALAIRDADLDVQRTQDSIDDQREELDQLEKMYRSEELTSATAEIVVKRAKRQLERTLVAMEMTRERSKKTKEHDLPQELEQLKGASEQASHALELLRKTAPHSRREKEAATAKARVEAKRQEEQVAKLKEDIAALEVRAPIDGIVYCGTFEGGKWSGTAEALKALRIGEKAQAGPIALTVVGAELDVRVAVGEKDLHQFTGGLEAVVKPVGFPSLSWKGKTVDPAPIAEPDGTFEARIKVGASAPRLVAGMKAKVTMPVAEVKGALLLPVTAVADDAVTLKDGTSQPVKTGRTDGKMIEILDGLKEGDEVLAQPKK